MATEVWVKAAGLMTIPTALARLVNPVDDFVFAVALAELDFELQFGAGAPARRLDVGQRLMPVDRGLALAEQVEVRPVQDVDDAAHDKRPPHRPAGAQPPTKNPRDTGRRVAAYTGTR